MANSKAGERDSRGWWTERINRRRNLGTKRAMRGRFQGLASQSHSQSQSKKERNIYRIKKGKNPRGNIWLKRDRII